MIQLATLVVPALAAAPAPAAPPPPEPPVHGVVLSLDAYGTALVGHVLVDTEVLEAVAKLTLRQGEVPRAGKDVALADGLRILGLPQGERIVQGAIDTMLYFDANADGYLDALDPAFAALRLFVDANGDGKAQPAEVRSFGEIGIDSISKYGSIRMKGR